MKFCAIFITRLYFHNSVNITSIILDLKVSYLWRVLLLKTLLINFAIQNIYFNYVIFVLFKNSLSFSDNISVILRDWILFLSLTIQIFNTSEGMVTRSRLECCILQKNFYFNLKTTINFIIPSFLGSVDIEMFWWLKNCSLWTMNVFLLWRKFFTSLRFQEMNNIPYMINLIQVVWNASVISKIFLMLLRSVNNCDLRKCPWDC